MLHNTEYCPGFVVMSHFSPTVIILFSLKSDLGACCQWNAFRSTNVNFINSNMQLNIILPQGHKIYINCCVPFQSKLNLYLRWQQYTCGCEDYETSMIETSRWSDSKHATLPLTYTKLLCTSLNTIENMLTCLPGKRQKVWKEIHPSSSPSLQRLTYWICLV